MKLAALAGPRLPCAPYAPPHEAVPRRAPLIALPADEAAAPIR